MSYFLSCFRRKTPKFYQVYYPSLKNKLYLPGRVTGVKSQISHHACDSRKTTRFHCKILIRNPSTISIQKNEHSFCYIHQNNKFTISTNIRFFKSSVIYNFFHWYLVLMVCVSFDAWIVFDTKLELRLVHQLSMHTTTSNQSKAHREMQISTDSKIIVDTVPSLNFQLSLC